MKFPKYIFLFGGRLLRREWWKYSLAFLSLFVTSVTFTVVLIGVDGARSYLDARAREFAGGDLVLESGTAYDVTSLVQPLQSSVRATDRETSLMLSVRNGEQVTAVSARAVSAAYPLYGSLELLSGTYRYPAPDEVYVEGIVLDRLGLSLFDEIAIGQVPYRVIGVIDREPDALVQGFRLAPRLLFSEEGLVRSGIVLAESRNEFEYRFRLESTVSPELVAAVAKEAEAAGLDARIAGSGESGILRRLANTERFFLVTVLIGAVLAAVNVYANALSLVTRLRKSFAVLLVEGATRRAVTAIVLGLIGSITLLATGVGIVVGLWLVHLLYTWLLSSTGVALLFQVNAWSLWAVLLGTFATSLAAAFPAVRDLLALDPRSLLSGIHKERGNRASIARLALLSFVSFLPLFFLAWFLLGQIERAGMVIGGTLLLFLIVSGLFGFGLQRLYGIRFHFPFFVRTIIALKRADGVFGIVAATSIFIALTGIFSLLLLGKSLEQFFDTGIGTTVPSAYIIDVQSDQESLVRAAAPGITLFSNVRARIMRIGDRLVQERLRTPDSGEYRELGREFNLTYRTTLIDGETIVAGTWQDERRGEVSVEADFAKRVGIELGMEMEFFIQGVPLTAQVTSFRSTDTTSGLPYFYFVFHPADLERFPGSAFGYIDANPEELRAIERTLAKDAPNVSVLDTSALGETVREVTRMLLLLLSVITVPPLVLALLLLVTLVAMTFSGRQRDALRLQVLGATRFMTLLLYLVETLATVAVMALIGAATAMGIVFGVTTFVLEGVAPVYFDTTLLLITAGLLGALLVYALVLLGFQYRSIREALTYEDSN